MKEVILLGSGKTAIECPFNGTEIWATAKGLHVLDPVSDCSKVFINENPYRNRGYIDTAIRNNIPIVSVEDYATELFPLNEITQKFHIPYFRGNLSYMIAYAIYMGYEKMSLLGMAHKEEWDVDKDRPRITYWLGVAQGLGIVWEIAQKCRLWAVMQKGIQRAYDQKEILDKFEGTSSAFMRAAEEHGDPYCFVTGIEKDAITVVGRDDKGGEISRWHP